MLISYDCCMDIDANPYKLTGLTRINVILGKNGCGKSTILKVLDSTLTAGSEYDKVKYINPERGGSLTHEPNIEQQVMHNPRWIADTRRVNQFGQFRQQTVAQYRMLETSILRNLEANVAAGNFRRPVLFSVILKKINSLLENIEIRRDESGGPVFKIYSRHSGSHLDATLISSGESELISLAIECLAFADSLDKTKKNILLLDEPDVHLHPDLQGRLIAFLIGLVRSHKFDIVIATHSTTILGELGTYDGTSVALMRSGQQELIFEPIDDEYKKILPVFGAHPLSNVFNKAPILLVEGEDDERIWQQAVRSAEGRIKLYPVFCGSVSEMNDYEKRVRSITNAVYDKGKAFSLRDRDDGPETIDDMKPVIRMKLSCRAAENLLLSDDVLIFAGTNWEQVKERIDKWLKDNPSHPKFLPMQQFKNGGYQRKSADLKEIRLLLVGEMLASNKPWEVIVGQVIARQSQSPTVTPHSILDYLGKKVIKNLLPKTS